jgi:hypothetical protein
MRLMLCLCLIGLVPIGILGAAASAVGHDSLSPSGALHRWLPNERWVMRHWIPFDEHTLQADLGLPGRQLESFTLNDHHTLAALARQRGIDVDSLTDDLVAPWRKQVDEERLALLRDRTQRVLTQGHLAQHVFFHVFHSFGLAPVARELFGVSSHHLDVLRMHGMTPLAVARRHGGEPERVIVRRLVRLLRRHRNIAVARREELPAEADRFLARQIARLPCWVRSLRPTTDPGNPYGKGIHEHGSHPRDWPQTARQRRDDERRVEQFRRALQWTCWPRIPRWTRTTRNSARPWLRGQGDILGATRTGG